MQMWKYILKRFLLLIPTILVVSFIVFFLMSLTGDAAYTIAGDSMSDAQIEELRESMGLNEPVLIRYAKYIGGVLQGDLGTSIYGKSVWSEFIVRLPRTIILSVVSIALVIILSIPIGIIAAVKQNTWVDTALSSLAIVGLSVPGFWLGLLLILLFSLRLNWLPSFGAESWKSIIMPALTISISNAALVSRMTRSSMLDNIRADFLRTARAKGVGEKTVILKHALKNALIPIITIIGSQLSSLIGGAVAIEVVFAWPGVGRLIVESIRGNDFPMVTGCVLMTTVFVALVLLLVDILYAFADPRIKAQYARK